MDEHGRAWTGMDGHGRTWTGMDEHGRAWTKVRRLTGMGHAFPDYAAPDGARNSNTGQATTMPSLTGLTAAPSRWHEPRFMGFIGTMKHKWRWLIPSAGRRRGHP
jgi:hypothetical protein